MIPTLLGRRASGDGGGSAGRSRFACAAIALLGLSLAAVGAPWIAPHDPYDLARIDMLDGRLPPGSTGASGPYWLGTDEQGRDLLSAILYGLRVSLGIGIGSALAAAVLGTAFGLCLACAGPRLARVLARAVDLQLAVPSILLAMMIIAVRGKSVVNVFFALILVEWAYYARAAYAAAVAELGRPYIEATEALGVAPWRIVLQHLLPNCMPPLTVILTAQIARAISLEATLSFLGVGVPITEPSLGLLIASGSQSFFSGHYWMIIFPGLFLVLLIVSLNVMGDEISIRIDGSLR
jgi:peptide/nickel transport system permease protein